MNFIRIALGREFSEEELDKFIDIVDDYAIIKTVAGYKDNEYTEMFDVAVFEDDVSFYYQILLDSPITEEDGNEIASRVSGMVEDDFELDAG